MSNSMSVSAATSGSTVRSSTRVPSAEASTHCVGIAPFPPAGPSDTCSSALWLAPAPPASAAAHVTASATASAHSRLSARPGHGENWIGTRITSRFEVVMQFSRRVVTKYSCAFWPIVLKLRSVLFGSMNDG